MKPDLALQRLLLLCLLILNFWRCAAPKLDPLDFAEPLLIPPAIQNFDAVTLQGQILRRTQNTEGECGFIWSYDRSTVEETPAQAQRIVLPLPDLSGPDVFAASLDQLERGQTLYVRCFVTLRDAEAGERSLYSLGAISFEVGEVVANTGIAQVFNDSAVVYGQLRGITELKLSVQEHGHVISPTNPLPTINGPGCLPASELGVSNDNVVFQSSFKELEFNTRYFVRAYAISNGETYYSKSVDTFRVKDGWERIGNFPYTYAEGTVSITTDGLAYAGFGCKKAAGCMEGDLDGEFWKFNPDAQSGLGEWLPSVSVPANGFLPQYNNTSFVLNGKFYAIFGRYFDLGNETMTINLLNFDLSIGAWDQDIGSASIFLGRTSTVSFVLQGKAYVGAGRDRNFNELNDFWEYNPADNSWRPVAPMPMQQNPSLPVQTNAGRYDAVAFAMDDQYAIVGAGQYGNLGLRDFWRFHPPTPAEPLGHWEQVAFLPNEAPGRYQAVAMAINGKGYVGTGYNATEGYLGDWWEYNPGTGQWRARTPLPGLPRTNAMGFAIANRGYLGTGHTKWNINGGLEQTERPLADFWRYIPEQ